MREQFKAEHIGKAADGRQLVRLVCELNATAAQSIQVLPLGPVVYARDGRAFQVSNEAAVVARSELPCLVDFEHLSEKLDGSTRAAGWINGFFIERESGSRLPGIYGAVSWTPEGLEAIKTRAYRFTSPVIALDPESRDAIEILSVALTNRPALRMSDIDADAFSLRTSSQKAGPNMTLTKLPPSVLRELHALGLTDEQIVTAQKYRAEQLGAVDQDELGATPRPPRVQRAAHRAPPHEGERSGVAAVDRVLLSRGLSPAEIERGRAYLADRAAEIAELRR